MASKWALGGALGRYVYDDVRAETVSGSFEGRAKGDWAQRAMTAGAWAQTKQRTSEQANRAHPVQALTCGQRTDYGMRMAGQAPSVERGADLGGTTFGEAAARQLRVHASAATLGLERGLIVWLAAGSRGGPAATVIGPAPGPLPALPSQQSQPIFFLLLAELSTRTRTATMASTASTGRRRGKRRPAWSKHTGPHTHTHAHTRRTKQGARGTHRTDVLPLR